mmetsp:Transcript_59592/g.132691  ORF Transcript_59592/g.132691 Transcript_59592/m.132691 type:complete len:366 (+) Transcript_59592:430-1527(+)
MQNIFLNIGHRVTLPSDRVNERRLYEFVFHVLRLRLISPRAAPSKKREAALVDRVVPADDNSAAIVVIPIVEVSLPCHVLIRTTPRCESSSANDLLHRIQSGACPGLRRWRINKQRVRIVAREMVSCCHPVVPLALSSVVCWPIPFMLDIHQLFKCLFTRRQLHQKVFLAVDFATGINDRLWHPMETADRILYRILFCAKLSRVSTVPGRAAVARVGICGIPTAGVGIRVVGILVVGIRVGGIHVRVSDGKVSVRVVDRVIGEGGIRCNACLKISLRRARNVVGILGIRLVVNLRECLQWRIRIARRVWIGKRGRGRQRGVVMTTAKARAASIANTGSRLLRDAPQLQLVIDAVVRKAGRGDYLL